MKHRFTALIMTCLLTAGAAAGCTGSPSKTPEAPAQTASSDQAAVQETAQAPAQEASASASESSPVSKDTGSQASALSFEAQDIAGNTVTSDMFSSSRLTMVNVWATYCNPCLNEMPDLGELAEEYDPKDFQLIGIISDVMEDSDPSVLGHAADLITQTGADYPHLLLNESLYYALLTDVTAVPTTFFIDTNGEPIAAAVGSRNKAAWKEIIDGLLEQQ